MTPLIVPMDGDPVETALLGELGEKWRAYEKDKSTRAPYETALRRFSDYIIHRKIPADLRWLLPALPGPLLPVAPLERVPTIAPKNTAERVVIRFGWRG